MKTEHTNPGQKASLPNTTDSAIWEARKRNNIRLAWGVAAFAFAVFLIAIWKYRPL